VGSSTSIICMAASFSSTALGVRPDANVLSPTSPTEAGG
jgi:hypothetical protein